MTRKVINPEIIQQRIDKQNQNNVWNYVATINNALQTNSIQTDHSIVVKFDWVLSQPMIDQILDTYQTVGWDVTLRESASTADIGIYPGETIFDFYPPTGSPPTGSPA